MYPSNARYGKECVQKYSSLSENWCRSVVLFYFYQESSILNSDSKLLSQCNQLQSLEDYITAIERVISAVKTQISRQLILHSFSSLSLKPDDFMFGLTNLGKHILLVSKDLFTCLFVYFLGTQDLNLLLRLLRLSHTNRFGCHTPDKDNTSIVSAIKQLLSHETECLARLLQICTRDIVAIAVKCKLQF